MALGSTLSLGLAWAWIVLGCSTGRCQEATIKHASVIERVELVRSPVSGDDVRAVEEPGIGWGWQEATGGETLAVPEGEISFLCTGPRYTAALAGRTKERCDKVWLFDPEGQRLGLAADYSREGRLVGGMGWNAEGTVLAVLTVTGVTGGIEMWHSVDLVAVETAECRRLTNLDFSVGEGNLAWVGDDLLAWAVTRWGTLLILEVDGASGAKHLLHRRFLWSGMLSLRRVLARPGERYLAVQVCHMAGGDAWNELWILDRETGWFGRAIYDTWPNDDSPVRWESEDRLLFWRGNRAERRLELWRAYLQPAGARDRSGEPGERCGGQPDVRPP